MSDHMKYRLAQAKTGDEAAISDVALFVYNKYRGRIVQMERKTQDPALAMEDMEMVFFEAILEFVPKADGRGDDFYHIGQRGVWAVQSALRVAYKQMRQRGFAPIDETHDEFEHIADRCENDFREIVHDQVDGQALVRVIANTSLSGRCREALDVIRREDLDPSEPGFNKKLAKHMCVSPQRTSQILNDIRKAMS